ncbi:hypothetical protein VP01_1792g1 [Puccinia sorghi]|uniref:Uncharacterized protein n=1 Tax=Puccinia sorghi TaxID=27349 RepID=A0A0L6VF11_9BASI|nr:hypothetical protein VP01_1792g1 [Puccinia sorghi]
MNIFESISRVKKSGEPFGKPLGMLKGEEVKSTNLIVVVQSERKEWIRDKKGISCFEIQEKTSINLAFAPLLFHPRIDMQHAPAKLPFKLHMFAYVEFLEQSLCSLHSDCASKLGGITFGAWNNRSFLGHSACQLQGRHSASLISFWLGSMLFTQYSQFHVTTCLSANQTTKFIFSITPTSLNIPQSSEPSEFIWSAEMAKELESIFFSLGDSKPVQKDLVNRKRNHIMRFPLFVYPCIIQEVYLITQLNNTQFEADLSQPLRSPRIPRSLNLRTFSHSSVSSHPTLESHLSEFRLNYYLCCDVVGAGVIFSLRVHWVNLSLLKSPSKKSNYAVKYVILCFYVSILNTLIGIIILGFQHPTPPFLVLDPNGHHTAGLGCGTNLWYANVAVKFLEMWIIPSLIILGVKFNQIFIFPKKKYVNIFGTTPGFLNVFFLIAKQFILVNLNFILTIRKKENYNTQNGKIY